MSESSSLESENYQDQRKKKGVKNIELYKHVVIKKSKSKRASS